VEESTNGKQKKGVSKGLIAIIVVILVLAGGTAAAFMMIKSSPKASYFLAEKDTIDFLVEQVNDRYQPELDWYETTQNGKTASTYELTVDYNDPAASTGYGMDPAMIINNSSLTATTQSDMENNQINTEFKANIGGMEINDFQFFVTDEKLMLGLPFLEETVQLKDGDLGKLLHEADPEVFTGEESLQLDTLFESANRFMPEEDMEYVEEEYLKLIYDELPEDAFTSDQETVEVNGESIDAEKIVLHLTEEQLKDIIRTVLEKMKSDDKFKEIIKEALVAQQLGGAQIDGELDTFISDFETAITDVLEGLDDFQIPNGLASTLWIDDKKIVQRHFTVEMGPTDASTVELSVKGSQLFTDVKQFFNYDFTMIDSENSDEFTMNLSGDLNWEDNQGTDSINLSADGVALSYEASETFEDGTREFDRTFSFEEPTSGKYSLLWSGNGTFEKDQMNGEHHLSVEAPEFTQDMLTISLNTEGQTIDSVDAPSEENVKDIGSMSLTEIQDYLELDVTPSFQQWLFGLMSGSGMGL